MTISRGETGLLLAMVAAPAILLAADIVIYERTFFVVAAPIAAALLLILFGIKLVFDRRGRVGGSGATERMTDSTESQGLVFYVVTAVTGLLVLGPRLGLPAFGLIFARAMGAPWPAALATTVVCAALVELVLVRLLGQPLPLLPILRLLGF